MYHCWQATYTRARGLPCVVGGCPGASAMRGLSRRGFFGLYMSCTAAAVVG